MRIHFNNGYAVSIDELTQEVAIINQRGEMDCSYFETGEELLGIMTNVKKIIT
tara:strand:+ start:1043 stop:1201 length:159 start_codon:yes stop_codon:yes gene_type:complete